MFSSSGIYPAIISTSSALSANSVDDRILSGRYQVLAEFIDVINLASSSADVNVEAGENGLSYVDRIYDSPQAS